MRGVITFLQLFHKHVDNLMKHWSLNGKDLLQLLDVVHQILGHIVHGACQKNTLVISDTLETSFFLSSEHSIHI